jgi:hypothetical protein
MGSPNHSPTIVGKSVTVGAMGIDYLHSRVKCDQPELGRGDSSLGESHSSRDADCGILYFKVQITVNNFCYTAVIEFSASPALLSDLQADAI